mmetsp:Transcript_16766/g.24827  ORF Transcript_16766/g.24827 Transcript_16766/m.24827 type:complete len:105 (+) Transcript_16766:132-446(+)
MANEKANPSIGQIFCPRDVEILGLFFRVEQDDLRADWAETAPNDSPFRNSALKVSYKAGENSRVIAQIVSSRHKRNLWTVSAVVPVHLIAGAKFIAECQYQVKN